MYSIPGIKSQKAYIFPHDYTTVFDEGSLRGHIGIWIDCSSSYEKETVLIGRNVNSDRTWERDGCCGGHDTNVSKNENSSGASLYCPMSLE